MIVKSNKKNGISRSRVLNSREQRPSLSGVEQEVARKERDAGEAAILAKLDVEQQAEVAMAKALNHPEVYATVRDRSPPHTAHETALQTYGKCRVDNRKCRVPRKNLQHKVLDYQLS